MKAYRWEVECEFRNGFMHQYGRKVKVVVISHDEPHAKHEAKLSMCRKIGVSTMFHYCVKVRNIRNLDPSKKRSSVFR